VCIGEEVLFVMIENDERAMGNVWSMSRSPTASRRQFRFRDSAASSKIKDTVPYLTIGKEFMRHSFKIDDEMKEVCVAVSR
jgi:hypothetical protein